MKWSQDIPSPGDMVRVKIGSIYHYGIFVSEDEIIQFGPPPVSRALLPDSAIEVCVSDVQGFLLGGFIETAKPERKDGKRRKPKLAIEYARSKIGQKGYNILYNNCEHFAYECLFGVKKCTQADDIRALFRAMPILDVYTAKIPEGSLEVGSIYPGERASEIEAVSNPDVRAEKYYVWKLLAYALSRTFGYKIEDLSFEKTASGKWICDRCKLSLSHADGVVAVALSRGEVGVDVEAVRTLPERVCDKILTDNERTLLSSLSDEERNFFVLSKWSEKEALFKKSNDKVFHPSSISTENAPVRSRTVNIGGVDYILSVASDNLASVRYRENIDLREDKND